VDGVNLLTGASDVGKSAVRRAIEWVLLNEVCDGLRKEGTKQTSVTIALDNEAIIERIRSTSINRYILRVPCKEEQVFDSIGKNIPEEVKDAIGIYSIEVDGEEIYLNSAKQIAMPFLFDKPASFRMKLFNKLTGTDLLDKLFGKFNKELLRINREEKSNAERLETLSSQKERVEIEKEQLEAIHKKVKGQIENLKAEKEKYDNYLNLLQLWQVNKKKKDELLSKKKDVVVPEQSEIEELTTNILTLERYNGLLQKIQEVSKKKEESAKALKAIIIPEINQKCLLNEIERLESLKKLESDTKKLYQVIYGYKAKTLELATIIKNFKKERDKIFEENPICPVCNREFTEDCIKELKK
jgi:uncharacterized protein (UPF0335 family)